ncbi:MAG: glycosyltransferase [Fimbriimonadaceae bacterium]
MTKPRICVLVRKQSMGGARVVDAVVRAWLDAGYRVAMMGNPWDRPPAEPEGFEFRSFPDWFGMRSRANRSNRALLASERSGTADRCPTLSALAARAVRKLYPWVERADLRLVKRWTSKDCVLLFDPWLFDVSPYNVAVPSVGMVMDLGWRKYPGNFREPASVYDAKFESAAGRFTKLCPISDCTAREVAEAFPSLAGNLKTVPHGAVVRSTCPPPDGPPTIFYPASMLWHKRHALLIEAFGLLRRTRRDAVLRLTGDLTDRVQIGNDVGGPIGAASQALARLSPEDAAAVERRGRIPWADVETSYREATVVAIPSAAEGFGLPFLEALEWDRPVVASDIPPFREQAERYDARKVVWVDSDDPQTWSEALAEAIRPGRWQSVPAANLAAWTWGHAAQAYLDAVV